MALEARVTLQPSTLFTLALLYQPCNLRVQSIPARTRHCSYLCSRTSTC
jgi:hypothetical protein